MWRSPNLPETVATRTELSAIEPTFASEIIALTGSGRLDEVTKRDLDREE